MPRGQDRLAEECLRIGIDAGYSTGRVTATRAALAERAGENQLLLMVDDAHLSDDVSAAALLLGIGSDRQVFVFATLRAGEAVPDAVAAL